EPAADGHQLVHLRVAELVDPLGRAGELIAAPGGRAGDGREVYGSGHGDLLEAGPVVGGGAPDVDVAGVERHPAGAVGGLVLLDGEHPVPVAQLEARTVPLVEHV